MVAAARWMRCPYCESDQLQGGQVEIDGAEARQDVWCLDCDRGWVDVYEASYRYLQTGMKLTYKNYRKETA